LFYIKYSCKNKYFFQVGVVFPLHSGSMLIYKLGKMSDPISVFAVGEKQLEVVS